MSEIENLNNETLDATITASNASAADTGVSEDTAQDNAYQSMIDEQADTIDALIAANKRLQQQMQQILRNGGIINDNANADSGINPPEATTPEQIMSAPDYEPLSALGKEIGKKPTRE